VKVLKVRIRELERLLGRKTLENEILKDAIEIAREKKLLSRAPSSRYKR
jgi:transposase